MAPFLPDCYRHRDPLAGSRTRHRGLGHRRRDRAVAVLPAVDIADKRMASGIVAIDGADVVALFRRDGASRKPALVRRFRRSKKADWEWIARPVDGVAITAADVIILRAEFERCERAKGLFEAVPPIAARRRQARRNDQPGRARHPSTIGTPSTAPSLRLRRARSRHAGQPGRAGSAI